MVRYKAGVESKENIYETAKQLFYENGFVGTTLADISKESETNKAMVSYYFKGKNQLALEIYNEYMSTVRQLTQTAIDKIDPDCDIAMRTAIEIRVQNRNCRLNQKLNQFYHELCDANVLLQTRSASIDYIDEINRAFNLNFNIDQITAIALASLGTIHALHTAKTVGFLNIDSIRLAETEIRMLFQTLGFEKAFIDNLIVRSAEMLDQIDMSVCDNFEVR